MKFKTAHPCAKCGTSLWSTKAIKFHACAKKVEIKPVKTSGGEMPKPDTL